MLIIERDRALKSLVADNVTMCEVFRNDAGAGFVFLLDVMLATAGLFGGRRRPCKV